MRCELAGSLLHRPKVLSSTRPTLGLDVNGQVPIRSFLAKYNESYGATVLLTSHYMGDVTALAKRVLVIVTRVLPELSVEDVSIADEPIEDVTPAVFAGG